MTEKPYNNIDVVIPGNVAWCDDKAMIWDVKLFYGVIRGLTRNDYYCCYASNERLAEQLGKKPRSIRRFLEILEDKGFIYRTNTYIIDKYDNLTYVRAIVPTDLKKQFEKKKEAMLDLKTVAKKCPSGGKELPRKGGKELPPNINMYPCKENKELLTNNKDRNKPPTPLQGGEPAATRSAAEQLEVLGKFGNVRLTKSQKAALSGEFGESLTLSLIEQLDCYIQSNERKQKTFAKQSSDRLYAKLREWALKRQEPQSQKQATTSDNTDEDITGGTLL